MAAPSYPVAVEDPEFVLAPGVVHVFTGMLDADAHDVQRAWGVLADEEQARAKRMATPGARARAAMSRGTIRGILSAYTGCAPRDIRLGTGPQGKPHLIEPSDTGIAFNVSHAGDVGVWAVVLDAALGVDIERVRPAPGLKAVAARYFAPSEQAWLVGMPEDRWPDAFARLWTCKEAVVKALGGGVPMHLSDFEVELDRGESPRLTWNTGGVDASRAWMLRELDPFKGYRIAVAVERSDARIVTRRWTVLP